MVKDVLAGSGCRLVAGQPATQLQRIAIDSRAPLAGALFVAFSGQTHDGHRFVSDALARGAAGALVERLPAEEPWAQPGWEGPPIILAPSTSQALQELAAYWRRRHDVRVVGVTGSVGKTTTKELIADLLAQQAPVFRTPANLNTEIGVPLSLMSLSAEHRFAVVEMGMYDVGDIRRLAEIAGPEVGVVTNVQPSHLERLGSMERIAAAKSELPAALPADGLAVLNGDDPRVREMAALTRAPALFFGLTPAADVWADAITSHGLRGIELTIHFRSHPPIPVATPLVGAHLVPAALAAVAVAVHLGIEPEQAVAGLSRVGPGLRLGVTPGLGGATVLDDSYNANPASTLAALDLLAELNGRRVAVLGDMLELGSFEAEGHRQVGERAAGVLDWLLTVGERARAIAEAARQAGMCADAVESYATNDEVIARLEQGLQAGDVLLLKGSRAMRLDTVARAVSAAARAREA